MRLSSKVLIVAMIVMMICCVSAASATDVDDIAVTEDADIIEVDDVALRTVVRLQWEGFNLSAVELLLDIVE